MPKYSKVKTDSWQVPVLIIGSAVGQHSFPPLVKFASTLSSAPTLHEFGIIILKYSNASFQRTRQEKWKEWQDFLRAGGTAIILGIDSSIQRHARKILNKPFTSLIEKTGSTVRWTRGTRFYETLCNITSAEWRAILPRNEERIACILGRNAAGDSVAFEVRSGSGNVIFLPKISLSPNGEQLCWIIDFAQKQIQFQKSNRIAPDWFSNITLQSGAKLISEIEIASGRLKRLERAKRILFEEGKDLSKECARILSDMLGSEGFEVRWKEEEGSHDIEVVGNTLTIISEVRGSSGQIDVAIGRQLMHHIQDFAPTTAILKGLIIGNAFRNIAVQDRQAPFTEPLIKLGKRNNYCMISAAQLLTLYDDNLRGTLKTHELVSILSSTVGPLERAISSFK